MLRQSMLRHASLSMRVLGRGQALSLGVRAVGSRTTVLPREYISGSLRGIHNTTVASQSSRFNFDSLDASNSAPNAHAEVVLANWSALYHEKLTSMARSIATDKTFLQYVQAKKIDSTNWNNYLKRKRRAIIVSPLEILGTMDELLFFKDLLDAAFQNVTVEQAPKVQSNSYAYCKQYMFDKLVEQAEDELKTSIHANTILSTTSDLSLPHDWYPFARVMKRKIFYHGGPTNSGKTYQAIQRLKTADPAFGGGLYCGPLRLLALEIYETLNKQGTVIDLLTGQEQRFVPGATHIACTIEMVSNTREYDVAVIDEIQMIADKERGHSWTKALLGLRAREIHVCGGLEAYQIVESLCKSTNDEFTLVKYDRLSNLQMEKESLKGDYSKVQKGDCVVAFSIADIFAIKREIEMKTNFKCAVIYGQLPSETRSMQARMFNDPNSGYDILVASDAIGMGLNLNIRRIVFHTTLKRRGASNLEHSLVMDPGHVKQIAGRAGRKSSNYPVGYVTAWQEVDYAYVQAVMGYTIPQIKAAGIFPTLERIELFYDQLKKVFADQANGSGKQAVVSAAENQPITSETFAAESASAETQSADSSATIGNLRLSSIMEAKDTTLDSKGAEDDFEKNPENMRLSVIISRFVELSKIDNRFYMCNHQDLLTVSNWLHTLPLSIADRFQIANAPVNLQNNGAMENLYKFVAKYASKRPVPLRVTLPTELPRILPQFHDLCSAHNIIDLYLWLSFRFPKYFIERNHALELKAIAIDMIERTLSQKTLKNSYSFRKTYADLRAAELQAAHGSYLPPKEFGDFLRNQTEFYLKKVDPKEFYIVATDDASDPASHYGRQDGPHRHHNFRVRSDDASSAESIEDLAMQAGLEAIR